MIRERGWLAFGLVLLGAVSSRAQEEVHDGEIISEIIWDGIPQERQKTFEEMILTKKGKPFSQTESDEDVRRLWQLKNVRAVFTAERTKGGALVLHVAVEEVGNLDRLEIRGNVEFTRKKILDALGLTVARDIREEDVARLAVRIRNFYREKGYYFVEIHPDVRKDASLVTFEVTEGPEVYVDEVRFHGNKSIPASRFLGLGTNLRSVVKMTEPFMSFPFILGGHPFVERTLDEDAVALATLYRGEGYRDAEVCYDFRFLPEGNWVDIDFYIVEGPLYRIREVRIEGNEAISTPELRGVLVSRPGDEFTDALVRADTQAITVYYGRQGFISHYGLEDGFEVENIPLYDEESDEVSLTLRVHEGPRRRLGDVDVRGNYKTRRNVILREVLIDPGEVIDAEKLARTIARLQSLRYFETSEGIPSVNYELYPNPKDPEVLDWLIDVEEGRTGVFNIGGGLASNSGPFLSFRWSNSNFGLSRMPSSVWSAVPELLSGDAFSGDGQSLVFDASPGLELSRFTVRFSEPDLFGQQRETIGLDLDLFHTIRIWRTHRETRSGAIVGLRKNLSREFSFGLKYRGEQVEFSDIAARAPELLWSQEGTRHEFGMGFNLHYRDVDIPMRPTTGFGVFGEYFLAGGPFQGDFDFHQISAGGEYYIPLGKDEWGRPHVLAMRGTLGWSQGFAGSRDVPYQDRFFLGGLHTLRGFRVRGAGPKVNDLPLGGEAMWRMAVEYQFPLVSTPIPRRLDEYEWMRGYLWNDWGALGLDISDRTLMEVRTAAGVGVRIRLPFLPQASLDFSIGYPLLRERTDDVRVFQFQLTNL